MRHRTLESQASSDVAPRIHSFFWIRNIFLSISFKLEFFIPCLVHTPCWTTYYLLSVIFTTILPCKALFRFLGDSTSQLRKRGLRKLHGHYHNLHNIYSVSSPESCCARKTDICMQPCLAQSLVVAPLTILSPRFSWKSCQRRVALPSQPPQFFISERTASSSSESTRLQHPW